MKALILCDIGGYYFLYEFGLCIYFETKAEICEHVQFYSKCVENLIIVNATIIGDEIECKDWRYRGKLISDLITTFNFKAKMSGLPLQAIGYQKPFIGSHLQLLDNIENIDRFTIPDWVNSIEGYTHIIDAKEVYTGRLLTNLYGVQFGPSLKKIHLSPYFKTIESDTFKECKNLERLDIPRSTEWIRSGAFDNLVSLRELNFHTNGIIPNINRLSYSLYNLETLTLPPHVTSYSFESFGPLPAIKLITAPKRLTLEGVKNLSTVCRKRIERGECEVRLYGED